MKASAILLMAGSGSRFKKSYPKQFYKLLGTPVYIHTLKQFIKSAIFQEIILCCHSDYIDEVKKETEQYQNVKVVSGGKTRQQSSFNAINACSDDCEIVLIHDAVRPFVSTKIIRDNLTLAQKYKAVNTCIESTDTLVKTSDKIKIDSFPDRKSLMRGQTPQTFEYSLIKKAHLNAIKKNITNATDDCQLVFMLPHPVYICKGEEKNIKITTPFDINIAKQILQEAEISLEPSDKSFEGKKYILIGASGGIGKHIHNLIEQNEGFVIPVSLKNSKYKMDLTKKESIKSVLEMIHSKYGPVDGLINSAGLLHKSPLSVLTDSEIDNLININLTGVIYCCKFTKIKRHGHIINVSSSSYVKGRKNHSIYSSSKAALVNFTQALAEEREDLYINSVVPQRTNTNMRRSHFYDEDPNELLSPDTVALEIINILKNEQSAKVFELFI